MNLVIVESPTKARTIGKFLGSDYEIKASMGHVMDLPKSKIGIDFEHDFEPQYEVVGDKKKIISELKSSAKSADTIILATDPDREGEAIAYHVAELLTKNAKDIRENSQKDSRGLARIVFHEITKEAIEEALKNPRNIDNNLVDAQTARRVLDRLVGYKLSPVLWRKVRRGLSAGRVQSVALRLIVEREREIERFGKEKYWTINVILVSEAYPESVRRAQDKSDSGQARLAEALAKRARMTDKGVEFELIEVNGKKIEEQEIFQLYDGNYKVTKTIIDAAEKAKNIVEDIKTKNFKVSDVLKKEMQRSPQPPYTTSTLQQDAARKLGFAGRRTMRAAQKLYEEGLITYHRTDSVAISFSAQSSIRNFISKEFGGKYLPEKPRFYATRQKLAQEAHEAIRPTKLDENSKFKIQNSKLGNDCLRLYELIWRRAVASQMSNAIIESTTVFVDVASSNYTLDAKRYTLKANGSVLIFDGFLKVNPLGLTDNRLPKFATGEELSLINVLEKEHETLPPPRYNDASLIKSLEEEGIGRPSTYAAIISTIEDRKYMERGDPTTGSGRGFQPTSVGIAVNDFLVKNFSDIDDIPFTAQMEDELDNIASGKLKWQPMIKQFYDPFEKKLKTVEQAERVKIAVEETEEICPSCKKGNLVIRTGRFGKFLSCSTFPACKFTKAFVEETNLKCPKDGGNIVIKKTRRGRRFYGCSNYPKCDFAAWKLEDIKNTTSQHVEPQRNPASREK